MMVALWFFAIGVLASSSYRIHNYVLSCRAHKRYDHLKTVSHEYYQAWNACWADIWGRESTKSRGWLTEPQRAELDAINERIGAIQVQMAECAEEF